MQEQPHFSKAPITEALIDLRVSLSENVSLSQIEELGAVITSNYPSKENMVIGHFTFQLAAEFKAERTERFSGLKFTSEDRRRILQARLDGFTFSVLAPYDRWESFRDESHRLWNLYQSFLAPVNIERIAVRYINRLDISGPAIEIGNYLKTFPQISADLPQLLSNYFMQLQIPVPDLMGMLVINQTIVPPPGPDIVSVLLDIDLFRETQIPQDESELWELFEQLRHRKNAAFMACITEKTKELIS